MPISIRDPKAEILAKELASRRGTNMTQAIISALEDAIAADRAKVPLAKRVAAITAELKAKTRPGGREMSREEIDSMWGA